MLEAASVLVTMNEDPENREPRSIPERDSSSSSPRASAISDPLDEDEMSSRTSTPSQAESYVESKPVNFSRPRRQDSVSSVFSRSYQSTTATSWGPSSAPNDAAFSNYPRRFSHSRPSTAYVEEPDVTAAAEGLVSCSLGTPSVGPAHLDADIPPVPALPAKFANQYNRSPLANHPVEVDMTNDDYEGVFGRMES